MNDQDLSQKQRKYSSRAYVKIGKASQILGISIDTIRRWESTGKIEAIRTPGGTRIYPLKQLKSINPQAKNIVLEKVFPPSSMIPMPDSTPFVLRAEEEFLVKEIQEKPDHKTSPKTVSQIGILSLGVILFLSSLISASYLTFPKQTKNFFSEKQPQFETGSVLGVQSEGNNMFYDMSSIALSPFNYLAKKVIKTADPKLAKDLEIAAPDETSVDTLELQRRVLDLEERFIELSDQTNLIDSKVRSNLNP